MKKIYSFFCVILLLMAFGTAHAQVVATQDFEDAPPSSGADVFTGWSVSAPPFSTNTTTPCEGNQSVRIEQFSGATSATLTYIDPTTAQEPTGDDVEISFDYRIINASGGGFPTGNFGQLELFYTIDGGTTWVSYDTLDQNDITAASCFTQTNTITSITANSDFGWKLESSWSSGDWYVYIDDFKAIEQVSCIQPLNLEVDTPSITYDGASIDWEDINNPTVGNWEVSVCVFPNIPGPSNPFCPNTTTGTGTIYSTTTPNYTFTGLDDGEVYYVWVRSNCGPSDDSQWTGPLEFRTKAIGTECAAPIEINTDPNAPIAGDLPYLDSSNTDIYGDVYSGNPGASCNSGGVNVLDGYEVVYHYVPSADDILTINLTGLGGTASHAGVFVYEGTCSAIGTLCVGGGISTGADIEVNSLFVTQGQDYYIVVASSDAAGEPENSPYTIEIEGFDCTAWEQPEVNAAYLDTNGDATIPYVLGQELVDFSNTGSGVYPTINGATLQWYADNSGVPGAPINPPLNIALGDQDVYWVTQNVGGCESPFLQVTFDEFDCNTELSGILSTTDDFVCESGSVTLSATANTITSSEIFWYDAATGGEVVSTGSSFTTPVLNQTTSYWVTEVFTGEGLIDNQANPGPESLSTSTINNYGLKFSATQPFTLVNLDVYAAGGGTITLELQDAGGTQIKSKSLTLLAGTASSPTLNTIILNWDIPSSGDYIIKKISGPSLMITPSASANFPYPIGNSGEVTGGATASGNSSSYYYFYNWTITGPVELCETTRVQVDAIVEDIIPTTVSADDMFVCVGGSTNLYVQSANTDYNYTWEWNQAGTNMTASGDTVNVTPGGDTEYTVTAVDSVTGCEFINTIMIETRGVGNLPLTPSDEDICLGETIALNSGGVNYDFQELVTGITGWTTVNNSTGISPASAEWKLVNSPYGPTGGTTSNDNSQFYISTADVLGPGASLDSQLISPSINLVGVANAELEFHHFFRYIQTQQTTADIDVRVNQGPWINLESFGGFSGSNIGENTNFKKETIDLSSYTGSDDVQIRFRHEGGWGWWWAVDNVTISRTYLDGIVSWSPTTDLYFDDQATIPYDGSPAVTVYFNGNQAGSATYTATLDILDCTDVSNTVNINVIETLAPAGSNTQDFTTGEVLNDFQVTGTNLKWYILDQNGDYVQVSINYPITDGETYYVTQTANNCESDFLAITAMFNCPAPTNLEVIPSQNQAGTAADLVIKWDEPANSSGVADYYIVIKDNNDNEVYSGTVSQGEDFAIVTGLDLNSDYTLEMYSVCDPSGSSPVNSDIETLGFNTSNLSTANTNFVNLDYYPNPAKSVVYFENKIQISSIEILSITGQSVLKHSYNSNKVSVDLTSLAAGTYFASVKVDGTFKIVRIIKE